GPTWPNRLFVHCAQSGGLDDSPSTVGAFWKGVLSGNYALKNIYDVVANAGYEWRMYSAAAHPQLNSVNINKKKGAKFATSDADCGQLGKDLGGYSSKGSLTFLEPDYGALGVNV